MKDSIIIFLSIYSISDKDSYNICPPVSATRSCVALELHLTYLDIFL